MNRVIFYIALGAMLVSSCTADKMPTLIELDNELRDLVAQAAPTGDASFYILPDGTDLSEIPQDPKNPLTPEKVALGKMMFFDTGFAQDALKESGIGTYSCATCHVPEAGFKPNMFQGVADGGIGFGILGAGRIRNNEYREEELDVQAARPLTMVNVAFVPNTFWNGQFGSTHENVGTEDVWDAEPATQLNKRGFQGIETQNFDGLKTHRIRIDKEALDRFGYTELYDQVFGDVPLEERYTTETASLAYSAYIRTIIGDKAPFQDWLKGDNSALNYEEKKGGILFFGKANCSNCHYNQNLGSMEFHALGVKDMYQTASYNPDPNDKRNLGRGGFTLKEEDNFKFKVPGLYNIKDTKFYFHGASKQSLDEVIEYKIKAQTENSNVPQELISEKFLPLNMSQEEIHYLKAFLEKPLSDPDLTRYVPEEVMSGFCFPNNDPQSNIDTGCK